MQRRQDREEVQERAGYHIGRHCWRWDDRAPFVFVYAVAGFCELFPAGAERLGEVDQADRSGPEGVDEVGEQRHGASGSGRVLAAELRCGARGSGNVEASLRGGKQR